MLAGSLTPSSSKKTVGACLSQRGSRHGKHAREKNGEHHEEAKTAISEQAARSRCRARLGSEWKKHHPWRPGPIGPSRLLQGDPVTVVEGIQGGGRLEPD